MSFVVVYDACVLYPNTLRDLLIRIAHSGLVQAKWSDEILDEVFSSLAEDRPDLDQDKLKRTRYLMDRAIPDSKVEGYKKLIPVLDLPDPDDRHVLAVAIKAKAQLIVTENIKDFPEEVLRSWDVIARKPDDFILDQLDIDEKLVFAQVVRIADSRNSPAQSVDDIYDELLKSGLTKSVARMK